MLSNLIHQLRARVARLLSLFLFMSASLLFVACQSRGTPQVEAYGSTMGTTYSVKVVVDSSSSVTSVELQSLADRVFKSINQQMSTYIPESELSNWNRDTEGRWLSVSSDFMRVLQLSQIISEQSNGAFDATVMPLVNLWGFGPAKTEGDQPSSEEIQQQLKYVGYRQLQLDVEQNRVRKPAGVHVDLSAIAKGFAADALSELLHRKGFSNHMVEVGGELRLAGHNRQGKPWRIGIESPSYDILKASNGPAAAVDLSNVAMATSGDYRNYYEVDGKRVSHTIDPGTGSPITHHLASVSVIAKTCAEADGWATAFNVMGPEKALATANRLGLAVYLITRKENRFESQASQAFEQYWVR